LLASITIHNFRCIHDAALDLHERGTGIVGANASGKTSLLEAIYFLAHGRSFRTSMRARMLGPHGASFRIVGALSRTPQPTYAGVEYTGDKLRVRLGGEELTGISAVTRELPVQIVDPSIHRLIEEGASRRRRLLDWGVFHVEQNFLNPWRRYQRALGQRNAALRSGMDTRILDSWTEELATTAAEIDAQRAGYVALLRPVFMELADSLLGFSVELEYLRGWSPEHPLEMVLAGSEMRDRRLKTTIVGPHRADLTFKIDGTAARDRVSRGQQKMLAVALILAQVRLRAERHPVPRSCLLLDDPAAELDVDNLGKVLSALAKLPTQLVITSLNQQGLNGMEIGRMFHVEQGRVRQML
jgi:DNA replication and repair protein RecF